LAIGNRDLVDNMTSFNTLTKKLFSIGNASWLPIQIESLENRLNENLEIWKFAAGCQF
jgi:hypothetical protein